MHIRAKKSTGGRTDREFLPDSNYPGIKLLKREESDDPGLKKKPNSAIKSLHQRKLEYENARARIFYEEIRKTSPKFKKIEKLRNKCKMIKRGRRLAVETIVTLDNDNRFFAKTKVGGKEVMALLDSGAGACCVGKNSELFLRDFEKSIVKLHNLDVKTANGGSASVKGIITLPVVWKNTERNLDFLIVPDLQQEFYFGVDFWRAFGLSVVGEPGVFFNSIAEVVAVGDDESDINQHLLTDLQRQRMNEVKQQFPSFAVLGLGRTSLEQHVIEVNKEDVPIKQRHYPVSPAIQELLFAELDRMLKLGVIEPSNSSWSSPVTLVRKETKNRLCLDARKLNSRTIKDAYPLPHIEGILSRLQETRYISAIDLKDAFWQIPLEEKSREKTAFTVPGRPLYQYTVMPFGLCNAAQRMCRLMDKVIPAAIRNNVFVYLDDLLVVSADFGSHMDLLIKVASYLSNAGLTINVEKSKFCQRQVRYLGFVVGDGFISTDETKVEAVRDFPIPKTPRQLRRFLGMCGWYRRFIHDYASIAAPLHECLGKENIRRFTLSEEALCAFDRLKNSLTSAPVLVNPDFSRHFYVQCDASSLGVGGVLFQMDEEGHEHPIAYMSAKLNKAQRNYSVTELECYAAVLSVKKFRPYIEGLPFTIITDHASLKWLMSQTELAGRLARWSLKLQAFEFTIEHRKGAQNVVPDALSRAHIEELLLTDRQLDIDLQSPCFDSEEYMKLREVVSEGEERSPDICISEKYIYKRTNFSVGDAVEDDKAWKLWVPKELQAGLVHAAHFSPSSGHGGIQKTLSRLRERYYWPSMLRDVQAVVKQCTICGVSKNLNSYKRPVMGRQFLTERPFQRVYIDFMGPYPRTKDGNTVIFVCLDHFTKYVLLEPMRAATAINVAKFLEKRLFHVFGVPEYIHSDNGRQFLSEIFRELMAKYGITHIRTGQYAPQANAAERVNRSILQMIRSFLGSDQRNWDQHISDTEFALRSTYHSSINMSPYYATFGVNMVQHASSYEILRKLGGLRNVDVYLKDISDRNQLIRDKVFHNLKLAHERSSRVYNLRSSCVKFFKGQVVYRRNFKLSSKIDNYNSKLAPTSVRCIVLEVLGNSLYKLGGMDGKVMGIFHGKDLFTI